MPVVFNLWSPFVGADGVLEFDVTRAETFRLGVLGDAWTSHALAQLGVTTPVVVEDRARRLHRCRYYSSYPDDADPRDRWPDGWTVRLATRPVVAVSERTRGPVDHSVTDSGVGEPESARSALLVAHVRSGGPDDVASRLDEAVERSVGSVGRSLDVRGLADGSTQVRLCVTVDPLAEVWRALDQALASVKAVDVATHWTARAAWPAPLPPDAADWLSQVRARLRGGSSS